MKAVARMELTPGMTLGEDIVWQNKVLIPAGTVLTAQHIANMKHYSIMLATVMEDADFATTHYEKLRFSDDFRLFEQKHAQCLSAYKQVILTFTSGGCPAPNQELLNIYNEMRATYPNGVKLLDYLYNLMPNEDELTFNHCLNSALIAGFIAEWSDMDQNGKLELILSGFYYDIGKLQLPYDLLWKPSKLTKEEFNLVMTHPMIGWNMLRNTGISANILDTVLNHHERMDGSGYPRYLKGSQIGILSRYMAIADTYTAMASPRPHRDAFTPLQIIESLERDISKYDANLLVPLMKHIAEAQIGSTVKLNDDSVWDVFLLHPHRFSRPILKNTNQEVLDLAEHPELSITKMV